MRFLYIFILFSALFGASLATTPNEVLLLEAQADFSEALRSKIADPLDENIAFSAFTLHEMLTMLYVGAAGSTKEAINNGLHLKRIKSSPDVYDEIISSMEHVPNITANINNKMFVDAQIKIKEDYKNIIVNKFHSEIETVNFVPAQEAANTINKWASEKTNQKIQNVISSDILNDKSRLVLVSATHFKGEWETQFDKSATATEPFYMNSTNTMDVQMMHITKVLNYRYDDFLESTILEVPFNNNETKLILVVPDTKDDFLGMLGRFMKVGHENVTHGSVKTNVHLCLPKFKIEHTTYLDGALEKIGLTEIYDENKADFSNMVEGDERIYVSKVLQKASVEINEEGGEGGVAMDPATGGTTFASPAMVKKVVVDRPFVFMIKCKDAYLFEGKVLKPRSGDSNIAPKGHWPLN